MKKKKKGVDDFSRRNPPCLSAIRTSKKITLSTSISSNDDVMTRTKFLYCGLISIGLETLDPQCFDVHPFFPYRQELRRDEQCQAHKNKPAKWDGMRKVSLVPRTKGPKRNKNDINQHYYWMGCSIRDWNERVTLFLLLQRVVIVFYSYYNLREWLRYWLSGVRNGSTSKSTIHWEEWHGDQIA